MEEEERSQEFLCKDSLPEHTLLMKGKYLRMRKLVQNEFINFCREMVEDPEISTNQDFEYIVQAANEYGKSYLLC